ncbi:hypothetical protein D3C81_2061790 [compost metagenome]
MLFDPRSQLSGLAHKQQLILVIVEHEDAALFPGDQVKVRKSVNIAQHRVNLLCNGHIWCWNRNADHYSSLPHCI